MKNIFTLLLCLMCSGIMAQQFQQLSSSEIYEDLEKFNFLGSVLYVAAHPDDENTRLISYMSNGLNARTAYLSLTRGDGGQNLIGTEIRELLGVIRSQELQMARSVDGGQQFFTRANDFGFSKHPDETLKIWNKDKVLEDIVYVIRKFKPDVIVNRFDHRRPGITHGHHTSSAMLAMEAFDIANDKSVYPQQLNTLEPWQVTRQFFNTSWWFYGSREKFAEADKSNLMALDVGVFYPLRGISNNEISALARSKHRSQGFGSSGDRGSYTEYLEIVNGSMPSDKRNIFDDIDTEWTRVKGGKAIKDKMDVVMEDFDFKDPATVVPHLLEVYGLIQEIEDEHWKAIKTEELSEIIVACMGLHVEASTDLQQTVIGDTIEIVTEFTNRSNIKAEALSLQIANEDAMDLGIELQAYTTEKKFIPLGISTDYSISNPYWLNLEGELGIYKVKDPKFRTLPESPAAVPVTFTLNIDGQILRLNRSVNYRYVNPAEGEIREPLAILPPATSKFDKEMYLFSSNEPQVVTVKVRASQDSIKGQLRLKVPDAWSVSPESQDVDIAIKGFENTYTFTLNAPNEISESQIESIVEVNGKEYKNSLINIDYDHIPLQTVLLPAKAKIVKVPMQRGGTNLAYIMGAGDKVPENLQSVGYSVALIEPEALPTTDLADYDAIIIGIRAYNAVKSLPLYNSYLFDYAENGGTLVTQYNTSRRLNYDMLSPYPLKLSRKRVTDEFAEVRILKPDHPVMNFPNKITSKDFDGWVQERGLYFPEEWDEQFEAIISCNDKGEDPLDGSLLVAKHGKGYFVYSSLSWFRELPAGVPGAYRLFANILALSSSEMDRP